MVGTTIAPDVATPRSPVTLVSWNRSVVGTAPFVLTSIPGAQVELSNAPLLPMFSVAPAGFIAADEFFRHVAEGPALGDDKPLRLPLGFLCVERVNAIVALRYE